MSHRCSKCDFTANFESALNMHQQLHHGSSISKSPKLLKKFNTVPRERHKEQKFSIDKPRKSLISLPRTSSATRLFDKIRVRLCKSKLLFSHPEEPAEEQNSSIQYHSPSKTLDVKPDAAVTEEFKGKPDESFGCHLCALEVDRITALDRHLLNDHKIGMENLLKLVMDKTKDGLREDNIKQGYGPRKSYYKSSDEFVLETGVNKIRIFKHASTNTDLKWTEIPDLERFRCASKELEDIFGVSNAGNENKELSDKIKTLNECMSRFLSSSKTLNKVLSKELSHKDSSRSNERGSRLGLGDQAPRERSFSEGFGRDRQRYDDDIRNDKKYASEVYF